MILDEPNAFVPLATVSRSGQIESVHAGCIAVSDTKGTLLAHAGNPDLPVYWRSTAKLHQAIPLLVAGGVAKLDLSEEQVAVICSSHHGEARQVSCVSAVLKQIGVTPAALHCGTQEPWSREAAVELIRTGRSPTPLHHMCSGNHAGLIGLAKLLGADPRTYDQLSNPAQHDALAMAARFAGCRVDEVALGVDGCGIPSYRTPLHQLATAFARLLSTPADWPDDIRRATEVLRHSIAANPEMLSATGELDVEVVRSFGGAALCKLGAECVCAAAFAPSPSWPQGVGIAIKIADGLGNRARNVALVACIQELELGTREQRDRLEQTIPKRVTIRGGDVVGEIRPVFRLTRT